jgi:hypothetical protein
MATPGPGPFELDLSLDREAFSLGQAVRPRLVIRNRTRERLRFPSFIFSEERLAFAAPGGAHLPAPDGRDLLAPYRLAAEAAPEAGLEVEAGQDEHRILPLSRFADLRQPGRYRFWLALQDPRGRLVESNAVSFELTEVETEPSAGEVALSLRAPQPAPAVPYPIEVEARFESASSEPAVILRPQQDSFDGWVNPAYLFTVTDKQGRLLPRAPRTGSMAEPVYDDDAFLRLPAGGSVSLALRLPLIPGLAGAGRVRVRLDYIVRRRAVGKLGVLLAQPMSWPPRTVVGRLESNDVWLEVA